MKSNRISLYEPLLEKKSEEERIEWYEKIVDDRLKSLGLNKELLSKQEQEELQEEFEAVKQGRVFLHPVLERPEVIYRNVMPNKGDN